MRMGVTLVPNRYDAQYKIFVQVFRPTSVRIARACLELIPAVQAPTSQLIRNPLKAVEDPTARVDT